MMQTGAPMQIVDFQTSLLLTGYLLMSLVALMAYWIDKRRAARAEWRISEGALHTIELLGGWPGAWVAQRVFRHKWRKTRYMVVFWAIGVIHVLAWAWWLGVFG
jgi:uncharacterized membrane protein YsdA (DUF1294 family)